LDLLQGVADALSASVLPELSPGPARDQVQAAIGVIRRATRSLGGYRQFLHDDIGDLATTLAGLVTPAAAGTLGPLLARAAELPPSVPSLADLVALDLALREAVADLAGSPGLTAAQEHAIVPLLTRMTDREAALRLSPWER
jgi:hypothetical protein